MKKSLSLLSIAVLFASVFASCNKVEEEITPVDEQPSVVNKQPTVEYLTFAISGDSDTKAILGEDGGKFFGEWENGDKLGSITTKSNGYSSVDATSSPVTFNVYSSGGLEEGNKIYLWYPYVTTQSDPTAIPMSIPAEQYQVGGDFDFSVMPMAAEEITVTSEMVSATTNTPVDVVSFYNLGSLIRWRIFAESSYTAEKIVSVTFNANDPLAGDFTKNIKTIDASVESTMEISGYTATSVTTNVIPYNSTVGTEADPMDVFMVVAPGSYSGTVVVVTNVATYTWTISSAQTFDRSGIRSFGLKLDKPSATRVEHVKGSFSFLLDIVSYDTMGESAASWVLPSVMTIAAAKGSAGTNTNNYTPPTQTSTRFYKNSSLTFTPGSLQIEKVEYYATSSTYATALNSSTWSNATSSVDGTVVTIVPTDGSAEFGASTVGNTTGTTKVKVFYDNNDYSITKVTGLEGGSIAITGGLTKAKVNTTIELEATPEAGYSFTSWSVTDASDNVVPVDGDSFQMPASNVTVSATFTSSASAKAINITTPSHGTVMTDPAGSATAGSTVTITATPDTDYEVETISVVDEDSSPVEVTGTTFIMPSKEVTVTVTFIYRPYEFTAGGWSSSYAAYTKKAGSSEGANGMTWTITFGGNSSSIGSNAGNLANCKLGDTYAKVGAPMSYTSSTTYVTAVISENTMSNISKVVVTNSSVVGTIDEVSLVYSTDDATYYIEGSTLTSKTNDAYTFEFTKKTDATYYAIVFKGTKSSGSKGYFRIDGVNIKYYSK